MPTPKYIDLRKRLNDLKSILLDPRLAKASLNRAQIDQVLAFALLSHAACEEFVEERCGQLAADAISKFQNQKFFGRVARHLCILPFIQVPRDRSELRKIEAVVGCSGFGIKAGKNFTLSYYNQIHDLLELGYKRYKKSIEKNHGIRQQYQFKLMAVIGLDRNKLGPTFSSRIEQLANLRGEAAHKATVSVTTIPEPSDLVTWTTDLIKGFRLLDTELTRLGNRSF
ncbi:MAG: hypothetical protein HZC25_11055 [Rhodospirillales bacterium]|nr:hypothetical protein [Rhodospirillales bacterium]